MSDVVSEFIEFITDDPLMLCLCLAIVVLALLFVLVLIFGGRKEKKKAEIKEIDNTKELLKDDLKEEPLKSTQEFSLNEIEKSMEKPPVVEEESIVKEEPISIEEALNLKNQREEINRDVTPIPVATNPEPIKLDISDQLRENFGTPVDFNTVSSNPAPVVPAPYEAPQMQPQMPFSSVVINQNDAFPKPDESLSKTAIIRHIPKDNFDLPEPVVDLKKEDDDSFDDIDLPKLNTNENTSVLNTLTGESFNIR